MIHYRSFRNPDPPLLAEVWNASLGGVRTVSIPPRSTGLLEYFTFSKPYFDPRGLILALDDDRPVGFIHAGFGPAANRSAIDPSTGIICTLGVLPAYRSQGIGSELLRRAELYLRESGAQRILAGPSSPNNPFTFALYGGSDSPGFLSQEGLARAFFERRGYRLARTIAVLSRSLKRVSMPTDPRFLSIHPRHDIIGSPLTRAGWWRECVLGPIEAVEYRLQEKRTQTLLGRIVLWDMATFSMGWGESSVGMLDLDILPQARRQGLARYLLAQVLMHLHQQTFERFEVCVDSTNTPALGLLRSLAFEQVETGHCFERT